jgi:hypothetical protein
VKEQDLVSHAGATGKVASRTTRYSALCSARDQQLAVYNVVLMQNAMCRELIKLGFGVCAVLPCGASRGVFLCGPAGAGRSSSAAGPRQGG